MPKRPIVLVHGYSDSAKSFKRWRSILADLGVPVANIHVGNYVTLTNEVTIKDIAEGFDRALRQEAKLADGEEFDAIVHSTGMLVVRSWLNSKTREGDERRARLKHLVALAPASNGSPLAHKGRSWLGAAFKGNKKLGPDFLEAGDEVLYGLELASRFTWDLAHDDLLGDKPRFGPGPDTPYVFTFCGTRGYRGVKGIFTNKPGTDGTVRWAGCALNSRKITLDLTRTPPGSPPRRHDVTPYTNPDHELILIGRTDHSTILSEPPETLQTLVWEALQVESAEEYKAWVKGARRTSARPKKRWQQFVVRVVDERGDPIPDWNAHLFKNRAKTNSLEKFSTDVHPYSRDPSLRCFHVDLEELDPDSIEHLFLKVMARSGTELVEYHGLRSERYDAHGVENPDGVWDAQISLTRALKGFDFEFFYPFTTTFMEVSLNREPMPLSGPTNVYRLAKL